MAHSSDVFFASNLKFLSIMGHVMGCWEIGLSMSF